MQDITNFFLVLHDPRVDRTKKHSLCKIIGLAVYAIIAGANTWEDMEDICEARETDLEKIMDLENGIPSHDTFQRIFSRLDPKELADAVMLWMQELTKDLDQKHIAIDGKTLRGSFDRANEQSAFHTLNAFVVDSLTILRHEVGTKKDSEVTMIPKLLDSLDLKNAVISIDAIGCQKSITQKIRKKKGDYLLGLKDNQPNLFNEVKQYFEYATKEPLDKNTYSVHQTVDKGHGRIESRSYFCLDTKHFQLAHIDNFHDIKTIIQATHIRESANGQSSEKLYFISSLECDAQKVGNVIRGHWAIENSLHHVLDVTYCEDDDRTRKDHAPANLSLLRKVAISCINRNKKEKETQRKARLMAMLNHSYAIFLLTGHEVKDI